MIQSIKRHVYEWARCTRHNLLHLRVFKLSFRRGLWHATDGKVQMVFPYYPYLAFHDIEGYLQIGRWKLSPGMTVLDVGGCLGEFSVYASKCVGPTGRVIMLEPDPANIEGARKNLELNGSPSNVEIVKAGLWKEAGKLRFNAGQGAQSTVVAVDDAPPGPGTIEIDVESLASLVDRCKIGRIDFVKMDIEGSELEAIDGAAPLPPAFKPRYAIASYHVVGGKRTADVLPERFAKLGYQARTGYERHPTTWAWPNGDEAAAAAASTSP